MQVVPGGARGSSGPGHCVLFRYGGESFYSSSPAPQQWEAGQLGRDLFGHTTLCDEYLSCIHRAQETFEP